MSTNQPPHRRVRPKADLDERLKAKIEERLALAAMGSREISKQDRLFRAAHRAATMSKHKITLPPVKFLA